MVAEGGQGQVLYAPNMAETRITVVKKKVSLHIESFVREKNCSITCTGGTFVIRSIKMVENDILLPHDIRKALAGVW